MTRGGGVQAYRRRAAAVEREIDTAVAAVKAASRAEFDAAKRATAEREAQRRRFAREDIDGAGFVHDGYRWRKVVRVNKTTVSVESGHSWVDRIKFKDVHGVQQPLDMAAAEPVSAPTKYVGEFAMLTAEESEMLG